MPSALETLVKILKLEQNTHFKNSAVIGGLQTFADHWAVDAHEQAKRPEHHQLVDEMVNYLRRYESMDASNERYQAVKYMLGRIMGRIDPPPDLPPSRYVTDQSVEGNPPPAAPRHEKDQSETQARSQHESSRPQFATADARPSMSTPTDDDAQLDTSEDDGADDHETDWEPESLNHTPTPPLPGAPVYRRPARKSWSADETRNNLETIHQPVTVLPKIGEKMAEKLAQIGAHSIFDLLYLVPRRYDD